MPQITGGRIARRATIEAPTRRLELDKISRSRAPEKVKREMIAMPLKVSPLESCPNPGKHAAFFAALIPIWMLWLELSFILHLTENALRNPYRRRRIMA